MGPQLNDVGGFIGIFFKMVWPLIGVGLLFMFIYGGFMWALGSSNPQSVQKARAVLMWAVIGTILAVFSIGIVNMIGQVLWGTNIADFKLPDLDNFWNVNP